MSYKKNKSYNLVGYPPNKKSNRKIEKNIRNEQTKYKKASSSKNN